MNIVKAAVAPAFMLLAGCITYPYQSAFDACDAEAGACYRYCEDVAADDRDYAACHADCEFGANQCFADAYDRYSYGGSAYSGAYYQPSWPWYGRYGAWGPSNGYYFDFSYWGGSSRYDRPRRGRDYGGRNRGRRGGWDNDGGSNNPRPPRGDRGGEDPDRTGDYPTPNRKDRIAPPLQRRTAPPPQSAPVQRTAPPAQPPAQPAPQASPPPSPSTPAERPAPRKNDRGSPRRTQPEDY